MTVLTRANAKRLRKFVLGVPGAVQLVCSAVAVFVGLSLLLGVLWFGPGSSADVWVGIGSLVFPVLPFLQARGHRFALLGLGLLAMLPYIFVVVQKFGVLSEYAVLPSVAAVAGLILGLARFERSSAAA